MTHETSRIDLTSATPVIPPLRQGFSPYVQLGFKRSLDVLTAALCLVLLSPLIGFLWWRIRRDGGPGFYSQSRVGRNGRIFQCWKLRSMVVDAERALAEHLATDPMAAQEWAATQKLAQDPRITPLGHVIRKYSLDELPQLWNVLLGEMSLIGPRPVREDELALYGSHKEAYLTMRPGVSGLWQVSGRNSVTYARRVALDVCYANKINAFMDLRIALATIRVVLKGTGQ